MKPRQYFLVQVPNYFGTFVTQYRFRTRRAADRMATKLSHSRVISLSDLKKEKLFQ